MQALCSAAEEGLEDCSHYSENPDHDNDLTGKKAIMRCTSAWTMQQDSRLVDLISCHGVGNWKMIAKQFEHKSPKQCRDRW